MCCSLFQEKKVRPKLSLTTKQTDVNILLCQRKTCIKAVSRPLEMKLIQRGREQALSQIQYHSDTKRDKAMMGGYASHLHLYKIYLTLPI